MYRVSKFTLGSDLRAAIPQAKNQFRMGTAAPHRGDELSRLITFAGGSRLYEFQVGEAHVGDSSRAGSRRLVFYVESGQLKRVFFNGDHYHPGSWVEIIDY